MGLSAEAYNSRLVNSGSPLLLSGLEGTGVYPFMHGQVPLLITEGWAI